MRRPARYVALLVATTLAGCGGAGVAAGGMDRALVGTWAGTASQWHGGDRSQAPDERWSAHLTLHAARPGEAAGTVAYPTLACGGRLVYLGPAPTGRPGEGHFRERLTWGEFNCLDGGDLYLRRDGDRLEYTWKDPGSAALAGGFLDRAR